LLDVEIMIFESHNLQKMDKSATMKSSTILTFLTLLTTRAAFSSLSSATGGSALVAFAFAAACNGLKWVVLVLAEEIKDLIGHMRYQTIGHDIE
jgi:hypothetical protein